MHSIPHEIISSDNSEDVGLLYLTGYTLFTHCPHRRISCRRNVIYSRGRMHSPLKKIVKVSTYGFSIAATFIIGLVSGSGRGHKIFGDFSRPTAPPAHADVPVGSGGGSGGDGCAGCIGSGDGSGGGEGGSSGGEGGGEGSSSGGGDSSGGAGGSGGGGAGGTGA